MGILIGFIWNQVLLGPATNFIVALDRVMFNSYGLAVIVFTIVLRLVTLPLTIRQMQSSKKMTRIQPRIQEIQKKYSDPKVRSQKTMELYKEEGVNPAGCLVPTLIQFPIWIALYEVIRITLGTTPESLIDLSHRLYPWSFVQQAVPLTSHFLWLNLGAADSTLLLPILVFVTMWVQQKLTMTPATMQAGGQTAQTNQMMLWLMPLLFAWFSINVPSGLALYWVITNLAGIALNYYVFEWHKKGVVEALGVRDLSLESVTRLFLPRARDDKGRGQRQLPSRDQRRQGTDRRSSETVERNGDVPAGDGADRLSRQAKRRAALAPQRKTQPKAPPVARPAPPVTGRLSADDARGRRDGGKRASEASGRGGAVDVQPLFADDAGDGGGDSRQDGGGTEKLG